MDTGKLKRLITIQRAAPGEDEVGQPVSTWTDVATVWADIAHKSGLETIKGDAPVSVVQASILIRYRTDIDTGMRVVHGSTVYDIKAVLPDEGRREGTYLVCQTGAVR